MAVVPPNLDDEKFSQLIAKVERYCLIAGSNKTPGETYISEPSYIPVASKPDVENTAILAIDVGGTHTKTGLRQVQNGIASWTDLFDIDNNVLNNGKGAQPGKKLLNSMTEELARYIRRRFKTLKLDVSSLQGVGVVWSNSLSNKQFDSDGVRGVTGIVSGSSDGKAYRKGEWWNGDIADGDDVGGAFIESLRAEGFTMRAFIISNDTIFTAKALQGADAGVVASTGANSTIIPQGSSILCNSECGGFVTIPGATMGLPDKDILHLEDVMAGRGLPGVFQKVLSAQVALGDEFLKILGSRVALAEASGDLLFEGRELSAISHGETISLEYGGSGEVIPDETLSRLGALSRSLMMTAGRFAALMAYLSIYNQVDQKKRFLIALDSSQARFQAGYLSSLEHELGRLLARFDAKADVVLLQPKRNISVPMQGVARAVNDFLS